MQLPIQQCPYCGAREFVVGYQHHEAMITYKANGMFGNRARHLICKQCGCVVLTQVAQPQKFPDARAAW